jgi:carboxymethylenebutenolidase
MKKTLILSLLLVAITSIKISAQSCCQTEFASNDGNMAVFVSDESFRNSHLSPKAYVHISEYGGMMIKVKTTGEAANAYFIKAKGKSKKWLFVYQEWWGLNDHIKKQAEVFYKDLGENVNVLALDMYDGKLATDPAKAGEYMKAATEIRLEEIMKGGITLAGKKAKIGSVGWCFGGGLSLKSAIIAQNNAVACVMYYGMPVKDVAKLKTLKTDVLGLFATEQWISKEVVEEFAANMITAQKGLDYKIFDAVHGFSNPSNPKFDKEKSAEAYGMAINYLRTRLNK